MSTDQTTPDEAIKPISPLPWSLDETHDPVIVDATGRNCVAMHATDCGDPMDIEDMRAIVLAVNEWWAPDVN